MYFNVKYKQCTKCGISKSLEEFHRSKASNDGRVCWCKVCACREKTRHRRSERGRKLHRAAMRRYRAQNKFKEAMRARMRRALKRGKIKKTPCEVCGAQNVQAHHYRGYSIKTALDVVWLCRKHHLEADAAMDSS